MSSPPGQPENITLINKYPEVVLLTMEGALSDCTTAKLDSIKSDLATKLSINPSDISFSVAAATAPASGVSVLATMPDDAAAKVVKKHADGALTTLGSDQVRKRRDCPTRLLRRKFDIPRSVICGDRCDLILFRAGLGLGGASRG
jgi:hypothetical protein